MEVINNQTPKPLPNANAVLVLGILSIVVGCAGIGLVLGIIGLMMSREGKQLYEQNPQEWTGYSNLNAGRIMSIIGVCIGGLAVLYWIVWVLILGTIIGTAASGFGNIF